MGKLWEFFSPSAVVEVAHIQICFMLSEIVEDTNLHFFLLPRGLDVKYTLRKRFKNTNIFSIGYKVNKYDAHFFT